MDSGSKRGRGRGRGGRGRGRGRARGRGRGKKATKAIESDEEVDASQQQQEQQQPEPPEKEPEPEENQENAPPNKLDLDMEADISQLEAPTFTTINRGPPEPMLRLDWSHKVNLIGEKILSPIIHCCDKCQKPILVYGRLYPCRHVFCLACGKQLESTCPRCLDKILRVEETGLGTVFMCSYGGTRYGSTGCRRTYLSERDLQAHINHRHKSPRVTQPEPEPVPPPPRPKNDPRSNPMMQTSVRQRQTPIQTSGVRTNTNLITVPIQDSVPVTAHEPTTVPHTYYNQYPQATVSYTQTLPPMHLPPPQQPQYYTATAYTPAQTYTGYTATAPTATPYTPTATTQPRPATQYDYSAAPPQWTTGQPYHSHMKYYSD